MENKKVFHLFYTAILALVERTKNYPKVKRMIIFNKQKENKTIFLKIPERVISLVPSQTELLYDLGLENNLVGITKFCIHPKHLRTNVSIIGGTKQVNFKKIKELQPDVIIANKEENTQEIVYQLSEICPVLVTDIISISDNNKMILELGNLFNKKTEAEDLVDKIEKSYNDFNVFMTNIKTKKALYFIWAKPYMVAGKSTFINTLLQLNKLSNSYKKEKARYPEIALKDMVEKYKPEIILLSSEPFPFKEKHAHEIQKIAPSVKVFFVDGEMFSWYGSRLAQAFTYFKKLQHQLVNK